MDRARQWSGGRSGERKEMHLVGQVRDTNRAHRNEGYLRGARDIENSITGWSTGCRRGTALAGGCSGEGAVGRNLHALNK